MGKSEYRRPRMSDLDNKRPLCGGFREFTSGSTGAALFKILEVIGNEKRNYYIRIAFNSAGMVTFWDVIVWERGGGVWQVIDGY